MPRRIRKHDSNYDFCEAAPIVCRARLTAFIFQRWLPGQKAGYMPNPAGFVNYIPGKYNYTPFAPTTHSVSVVQAYQYKFAGLISSH